MKFKLAAAALLVAGLSSAFIIKGIDTTIIRETTVDSLGACQGASNQNGRIFLYGDREVGMIREFKWEKDSLRYINKEYKLTQNGQDVIGHPTGIAYNGSDKVFIGNSIRLNKEGTQWKAVIYLVNWPGLQKTGTLDGNLISTIEDDACIQGTRPEYVKYNNKWYVATADYGNKGNEVRLYDPEKLARCTKTSEPGVLYKKFTCSPWVQNLHWVAKKGILILTQNQIEGRKWRLTYVDLKKSVDTGTMQVIKQIDIDSRQDELEGFTFIDGSKGIAVTSSRKNNVNYTNTSW
ncbi:hypothetical protein FPZ42_04810 [Mucilaginibacter achroorhodeus]|uniref:Uncharacterized protein n=1 Tax=Mucilaginibacter achroorhodeus TaxID=2599294 RepID=A0A563UB72_9SPHI|nr:hypothetical protein [Mucilaginibacter achroorhodeus]TWR28543.1 hypothetical protein FPZ42_04810 [Mucilaginibacter achroorhodeus]